MHHLAIMRKDWDLIPKILSGEKKIESRWYMAKFAPWNKINPGDTIYFKDAGEQVTAKAEVEKVLEFEKYSEAQLKTILNKYGGKGGIFFQDPLNDVFTWTKKRKYCILIFLKNPTAVEPFYIDKTGHGSACAWIIVDDIKRLVKR